MYIIISNKYTHRIENLAFVQYFKAENHPLIDFIDFLSSKIRRRGIILLCREAKGNCNIGQMYIRIYMYIK